MTEKQIIYGIVSDCEHYDEVCLGNHHYKQLKRAEQKLAKIKKYCTGMKKDYYWGMRMMRFANEILQIIEGKKNE